MTLPRAERRFLALHLIAGAMVFCNSETIHGLGVVFMLANYTYTLYRMYCDDEWSEK